MDSIVSFVWGLFVLVFWIVVLVGGISLFYFNKLRRLREAVKRRRANIGVALQKRAQLLNKVQEAVKNYEGFEQFTRIKLSQDSSSASLAAAFAQGNSALTALLTASNQSPNLQTHSLVQGFMGDIRKMNEDLETRQLELTSSIDDYNVVRGGIPCILFAGFLGFKREEYPTFDTQGQEVAVGEVKEMVSNDDARMEQLLQSAGTHLMGATKILASQASQAGRVIAGQAGQASKMIADRIKDQTAAPKYFYMQPGGVPKGPATRDDLKVLIAQGVIQSDCILNEVGSQEWKPLPAIASQWDASQPPEM